MRTLLFTLLLSTSLYSQEKAVVHINAQFNESNNWYGLKALTDVRVFNGYIEQNPAIKEKYNITKVSFNSFIEELENKEQPSCNIEKPEECDSCGS
jgi:hypothetical protein